MADETVEPRREGLDWLFEDAPDIAFIKRYHKERMKRLKEGEECPLCEGRDGGA